MVIGFDAKRLLHNHTGLGNYARNLLSALLANAPGHAYHLFSPQAGPHTPEWRDTQHPSLVYHHPRAGGVARGVQNSLWRSYAIAGLAARAGVQVFHGLSHELPHGLRRHRIRSIVTLHDLIFLRHPEWFPPADRFFYRQKLLRACREASQLVAISECTARDLHELLGIPKDSIRVVYQGVATDFTPFEPNTGLGAMNEPDIHPRAPSAGIPEDAGLPGGLPSSFILAVGNCDARKNYLTVLQAYAQLPADRPPLVLTGRRGNERKKIESRIREWNLTSHVHWMQPKNARELAGLYRRARMSVYLSRYEGFGLPVLESIACGTPVLAALGSSLEEAGGNAALYVPPTDAEAAALGMRRLLYDDALHQRLQGLCAPWAARFSDSEMARTWLELYERCLQQAE